MSSVPAPRSGGDPDRPDPEPDTERSGVVATCHTAVQRHRDDLLALAHSLHAEPEVAFAEYRSAAKITEMLAEHGFRVQAPVAGLDTAFVAEKGEGDLVIGLCAEYDALPEVGHACGHNLIAASSVGAALALAEVADELGLRVRVLGTPAEETGGGKIAMLGAGVFDEVAMAAMVHPAPEDVCRPASLAIADLEVRYTGRASHAASAPELGVNAADALTVAQVAIGLARQHLEPRQMVHGIVTEGGAAPNIVPAHTSAVFNLRAAGTQSLQRLENRIRDCFEAGAVATGCTSEVTVVSPVYTELDADPWLVEAYRSAISGTGRGPVARAEERARTFGSTDMGNVTRELPAIHPLIAVDCGDAVNHQAEFAAACASESGEQAVLDGARALAETVVAAATDPDQRDRLTASVQRRGSQRRHPSARPPDPGTDEPGQ